MTDTDNDPCDWRDEVRDWRDEVRDTYHDERAVKFFIADVERLLVDHRAMTLAYDSEQPADTYAAVLDIRKRAEELMRALFNPRAASWIAQGAMLEGVEDLTERIGALVVSANAALDEFGPPVRRGSSRQHPRLMFVAAVARAFHKKHVKKGKTYTLDDGSTTPETCWRAPEFCAIFERILIEAGIPSSNLRRLLAEAFPRP
jgi:hypothetical protein